MNNASLSMEIVILAGVVLFGAISALVYTVVLLVLRAWRRKVVGETERKLGRPHPAPEQKFGVFHKN